MRIIGRKMKKGRPGAVLGVFALVLVANMVVIASAATTTAADNDRRNSNSNIRHLRSNNNNRNLQINKLFPLAVATILDLVKANDSFTSLVQAITARGQDLVPNTMLGPKGQQLQMTPTNYYTLFAPNNNAFANLAEQGLSYSVQQKLFQDERWKLHLEGILLYHIVPGIYLSNNLRTAVASSVSGTSFYTTSWLLRVEGQDALATPNLYQDDENIMSVSIDNNNQQLLKVNDLATVVFPDIEPSNGVLHMIDQVLIPPFMFRSIFDIVRQETSTTIPTTMSLSNLLDMILQSGLADMLSSSTSTTTEGPYTLFAPTNEAFANLPQIMGVDELLENDQQSRLLLREILLYHIVPGKIVPFPTSGNTPGSITAGDGVMISKSSGTELMETANNGDTIQVTSSSVVLPREGRTTMMMMTINDDATVIKSDVLANNGIVHVIDKILLPPGITVPVFYKIRSTSYDPATSPENTPNACMEVDGGIADDGQRLILGDCTLTRGGWRIVDQVPAVGVGGQTTSGGSTTMIQSELDIDYCLQAGSDGDVRSVLRIERCDNTNRLQQWIFTTNGLEGPINPAVNPNLCVVWRGLNSNVGSDPITLLPCGDDNAVWKLNWVLG